MCGVVGVLHTDGRPVDLETIHAMRDRLAHRGPDDAGIWRSPDKCVALGHRRLSVVDLSAAGHQPMQDPTGDYWIAYNGEIYNHLALRPELESRGCEFRSRSDTEVILAAYRVWGDRCFDRLNGMFALGLVDLQRRCLVLARDRVGEKPLYVWSGGSVVAFASELKAFFALPGFRRKLDPDALNLYLAYGYVPAPLSMVVGVKKVEPATVVVVGLDDGRIRPHRYWNLPRYRVVDDEPDQLALRLDALLHESVKLRLSADVPVGISLSGGIDSSLVTAMAARVSAERLKTFTVTFPSSASHDERAFARIIARYFDTEHHELEVGSDVAAELPEMIQQYDEPLADSSLLPTFAISRLIRAHVTVALGGDGGDELFGGYAAYLQTLRAAKRTSWLPHPFRLIASRMALAALPVGFRGRAAIARSSGDVKGQFTEAVAVFGAYDRHRLLAPNIVAALSDAIEAPELRKLTVAVGADNVDWMTRTDFATYLPDDILTKIDRSSMRVALEVRSPWLDPALIGFAFSAVPSSEKIRGGRSKILPKRLAESILPRDLAVERKQGFAVPLGPWLAGPWRERMIDALDVLARCGIIRPREGAALLLGQAQGRSNATRLFALLMLGGWISEHRIET